MLNQTYPYNIQDLEYINNGQVYVYNLKGIFEGRTDYFIEDNYGIPYKRNLMNNNEFQLNSYLPVFDKILKSNDLKLTARFIAPLKFSKAWSFLGIDSLNRIYFFQGVLPLIIRRINPDRNTFNDLILDQEFFRSINLVFKNELKNVELLKNGEILLFGLTNKQPDCNVNDTFNFSDLSGSIVKIKF